MRQRVDQKRQRATVDDDPQRRNSPRDKPVPHDLHRQRGSTITRDEAGASTILFWATAAPTRMCPHADNGVLDALNLRSLAAPAGPERMPVSDGRAGVDEPAQLVLGHFRCWSVLRRCIRVARNSKAASGHEAATFETRQEASWRMRTVRSREASHVRLYNAWRRHLATHTYSLRTWHQKGETSGSARRGNVCTLRPLRRRHPRNPPLPSLAQSLGARRHDWQW